jgi:hypothetical protein
MNWANFPDSPSSAGWVKRAREGNRREGFLFKGFSTLVLELLPSGCGNRTIAHSIATHNQHTSPGGW